MKLYNHLIDKNIELNQKKISIYNCGPTVYNYVHIGNIRPLITLDVLHRLLIAEKHEVIFYHNITDIDDKIINRAIEEKTTEKEIASKYTKAYFEIMEQLNILPLNTPKVSENIDAIITYIEKLIDLGFAYEKNGNVYFETSKVESYGEISNRKNDKNLISETNINTDDKKHANDFVLWKKTDTGIKWDSPWSKGRPGWHTECSVLINKYIGDQVDIHGGGIDLKFPHHENENVQNMAMNNKPIAKNWMHVGHVNINNEKMSKSLNNFILAKDLLDKYNSNTIRWFFFQTSYHNPINFSYDVIEQNQKDINKIIQSIISVKTILIANDQFVEQKSLDKTFVATLDNDLDFPNAVKRIHELVSEANQLIRAKKFPESNQRLNGLLSALEIMGIVINADYSNENIAIIKKWKHAVDNKDYQSADQLRKAIMTKGLM